MADRFWLRQIISYEITSYVHYCICANTMSIFLFLVLAQHAVKSIPGAAPSPDQRNRI